MGDLMFREWRHALLGSLGLLAACGGEAIEADAASSADGTKLDATTGRAATTGSGGTSSSNVVHRPTPAVCEPFEPSRESAIPAEYLGAGGAGADGWPVLDFDCELDAECNEGVNGDCHFYHELDDPDAAVEETVGTRCGYGCNDDTDCGAGTACDCVGGNNRCISANCTTDSDCPTGQLCIKTEYFNGCGNEPWFACQTPLDECGTNSDCIESDCGFDRESGSHKCMQETCSTGRPFLIYGAERRAGLAARRDWQTPTTVDVSQLTQAERHELAARWETIGLMEHASIAAFARFALQLLSLGAPAELVERTHAALADETRHAKLAFGIASNYSGRELGPGLLAMDGALAESDLASVVKSAVIEGCIGETVAAAEARLGADGAEDPAVKAVLGGIAADESQHAELAFAFVRWAILKSPELAPLVLDTVHREQGSVAATTTSASDGWLVRHGLLSEHRRAALRRAALEHMVLPCLRAICNAGGEAGRHVPDSPRARHSA